MGNGRGEPIVPVAQGLGEGLELIDAAGADRAAVQLLDAGRVRLHLAEHVRDHVHLVIAALVEHAHVVTDDAHRAAALLGREIAGGDLRLAGSLGFLVEFLDRLDSLPDDDLRQPGTQQLVGQVHGHGVAYLGRISRQVFGQERKGRLDGDQPVVFLGNLEKGQNCVHAGSGRGPGADAERRKRRAD